MARPRQTSPILYKYYTPDRVGFFSDFRVRFSQLAALNDPFEFFVSVKPGELRRAAAKVGQNLTSYPSLVRLGVGAALKGIKEHDQVQGAPWLVRGIVTGVAVPLAAIIMVIMAPLLRRHFRSLMGVVGDDFEQSLERARSEMFLIFSCSEAWDSVPLWAHYAGNHTGFCIGVDSNVAFRARSPRARKPYLVPRPVKYLKRTPRLDRRTLNLVDFAASKMDHWSYEREWRYVGLPDDAVSRGTFISGHELLLFQMEPEAVTEVVFGVNCSQVLAQDVIDSLGAARISPALYQVQRSLGYGFERRRIESALDVLPAVGSAGPIKGIGPEDFKSAEDAFVSMMVDLEDHALVRRLNRRPS